MKKALMCDSLENFSSTEMSEEIYRERGLKGPHPLNTVRLSTARQHSEVSSDTDNSTQTIV